ncbi:MAG: hypothetical protein H6696_02475 [Deferribacteres bacterium]|nr:hypothetical protein [candidate division KSB1 bacterium]MCB9500779.1 hypothetical protein [Deferribacteres bacterium]
MSSTLLRPVINILILVQVGFAQTVMLNRVERQLVPESENYVFYFNKAVEYSTASAENPPAVLIYFQNAIPADSIVEKAWGQNVVLTKWMESPPVLKATINLPEKMNYDVSKSGRILTISLRKSETTEPQPKPANPGKFTRGSLLRHLDRGVKITADFRDADIGNVLRLFARQNSINIVASDSVRGNITVALHDVSLEQALESILLANGYDYVILNDVVLVKPEDQIHTEAMTTRVFQLKHANANNLVEPITELISEKGKVQVIPTTFHNKKDVYEVNDRIQPDRELRYWLRSSMLLVRDFPAQIEMIADFIKNVDIAVPQILIEAKLLEVTPVTESNVGIDWSKSLAVDLFDEIRTGGDKVRSYSTSTGLPNTDGRLTMGTLTTSEFSAVLNFLNSNTSTKLISNPRILAMDNEPSDISVGTNFPIPQINRGVGGQGDVVTFTFRDVKIMLRVTPHVTAGEAITMYVNPIIEEVTGQITVSGNTAPITTRREVDTVVKVKNGETIVIGGMIKEREVLTVDKVWLLGDIPLLGHFFQNKSSDKQQTDLVIFITPKIMDL